MARTDTERLDWLAEDGHIHRFVPPDSYHTAWFSWEGEEDYFETLRDAIDAAMDEEG